MNWRLFFVVFFASFLFLALILLLGCMHLFSLFLGKVTAPTPPTIALLLSLRLLLRFSKLCLTPTSSNISNITIFFQITSMASVSQDLREIVFPILLMPGHPLLGTSENHSSSLLISLRNLTESGISLCYPNFQLTALLLPSVNSFLTFYPIALYVVVVHGATSASFPVSSGVPQGSVLSPTLFLLFINDLHATASNIHSFANDSNLYKSSSFQCQPSSNARSQSRLAMSSTINSDLQSISESGTRNEVKFNTSKTQLLTISLSNTLSNYPIIFEDSEILPLNSNIILRLQISSSLSWRDHIVQIAKSASKKLGVLFRCKQYFNSAQLFKLYTGFIRPFLGYCYHIWGSSPYTSLLDRIESKAIRLIGDPSLTLTLDPLSLRRKVASLSLFYCYILVTALMNWLPVFLLQWLGHIPHSRQHLPTTIVWNAPMRELIGSAMVSSPLLPAFETLSLLLYFWLPSTFLPSKGRSITTLGTRCHDFFDYPF